MYYQGTAMTKYFLFAFALLALAFNSVHTRARIQEFTLHNNTAYEIMITDKAKHGTYTLLPTGSLTISIAHNCTFHKQPSNHTTSMLTIEFCKGTTKYSKTIDLLPETITLILQESVTDNDIISVTQIAHHQNLLILSAEH